ncbi:multicopper oxidase family protein [Micromonospora marina]|uniref:multicopper oxidase family protein n=1 Tax=Micromonospora marina TaxID=307120 RepID=UPI0034515B5C
MDPSSPIRRRGLLVGAAGAAAGGAVSRWAGRAGPVTAGPGTILRAQTGPVGIGARTVATWSYGGELPGPQLRAVAGGRAHVRLVNDLPAGTTVHWHGIRLENAMDGAPHVTQHPVPPGSSFDYDFAVPDPGTYFFHSHVGTQLDRGLYGTLVVEDPTEPLAYDAEILVVLDDWLDGVTGTPDDALAHLDHAGGDRLLSSPILGGHAGDVAHPYHLVNGRTPDAPVTLAARPGQRVRLRIVNAAADTAYRVALGGHRLRVTHSDGFPVEPVTGDALLIGMGERYDALVTVGDGAFPLVALAEGKNARGFAVLRTAAGAAPPPTVSVPQLNGRLITVADLRATDAVHLPPGPPDRTVTLSLGERPPGYVWTLNGRAHPDVSRTEVHAGQRVRLVLVNDSSMFHPMHLHGHTFQIRPAAGRGARKDTLIIRPLERFTVDLVADNPGEWMVHCHNLFHGERGMMSVLGYAS